MILDLHREKEQRDILFQLGMGWEVWRKLVQDKLKMIVIVPMAASSVMGAVFFFCDYVYQADVTTLNGLWSAALLKYAGAVVLFWLVQYGGYLVYTLGVCSGSITCGTELYKSESDMKQEKVTE